MEADAQPPPDPVDRRDPDLFDIRSHCGGIVRDVCNWRRLPGGTAVRLRHVFRGARVVWVAFMFLLVVLVVLITQK